MYYRVLRPFYADTGETGHLPDGKEFKWKCVAKWIELGTARSMEEAKAKFGGSPVLEAITAIH